MEEEYLENNPVFKSKLEGKRIGMVEAFQEKNVAHAGYAIARWKLTGILLAPCFMYLGYNMFMYTDPVLKKKNLMAELEELEKEKDLLERED